MPNRVSLALDCGSHAIRVLGFQEGCNEPIDLGSRDIRTHYPQPGFVEVDAELIATDAIELLSGAIGNLTTRGLEPHCLGITNMRETAVAWRRDSGETVHRAIHWMSMQSQPQVDRWAVDGTGERIRLITGLSNHAFFFGSKIRWLLETSEEARRHLATRNLQVGTLESWLLYKLGANHPHLTDLSNGSRYQMLDLRTLKWDVDLVETVGLTPEALPEIHPTHGAFGVTNPDLIGAEVPITGLIADQQASLYGHGAHQPGSVKATFGTSGVVCLNLGDEIRFENGLVTSIAWSGSTAGQVLYEIEASAFHSGSTINWLAEHLSDVNPWKDQMELSLAPASRRPYVIPAFSQLGAPRWPRRTGGAIVGLQLDSTNIDIIRAGFESMAFQTHDTLQFLGSAPEVISVDGGGAISDYMCQTLANLTASQVSRPSSPEMTSLGTAQMAVRGRGEDEDTWFRPDATPRTLFEPEDDGGYAQEGFAHWSALVERLLSDDPEANR